MDRTKAEFIARFKLQLAGLAMYGITSELKVTDTQGKLARAAMWMDMPDQCEKFLGVMYDWLNTSKGDR